MFVSRCQNLETEHNTTKFAAKVNDGGFYYTPLVSRQDEDRMTPNGGKHDWRGELTEELARRQKENGLWANANTRWMEGDSNLATSMALLALSYCRPEDKK